MDLATFRTLTTPPASLSPSLIGLWQDLHGNWEAAHDAVQQDNSPDGAWVHAYLHRKEGDASNARYWYQRSGRSYFHGTLEQEWERIAQTLLAKTAAE